MTDANKGQYMHCPHCGGCIKIASHINKDESKNMEEKRQIRLKLKEVERLQDA